MALSRDAITTINAIDAIATIATIADGAPNLIKKTNT